jgi:DNA modification methylase
MTFFVTSASESINRGPSEGGSIFDPVLCELAYYWFCPPGGQVFDPFAGGSVRGIVAGSLGRHYTGIDLRPEQIAANQTQSQEIAAKIGPEYVEPQWLEGDALDTDALLPDDFEADFLFTCPPYGDLEQYSDDPRDISNMGLEDFLAAYRQIIANGLEKLKNDRFCAIVVGDYRDPQGFYRLFPLHTVQAFEAAGARLYNEAVLVTAVGSLPIRVNKMFTGSRGKSNYPITWTN